MANAPNGISRLLIGLLIAALVASCSSNNPPTPTAPRPTPTETSQYSTHVGPIVRETLPATWTETPTATATLTQTPTPITPTATSTPIPALADLCASLTVSSSFSSDGIFHWNQPIVITLGTPLAAVLDPATGKSVALTVRFLAVNLVNGQNQGVQLNGGLVTIMELPASHLPGTGLYTWKIAVYGDGIGERCLHQGFFVVSRTPDDLLTATALALITPTPEPTEEVTQDGTIIPVFQGYIPIPAAGGN